MVLNQKFHTNNQSFVYFDINGAQKKVAKGEMTQQEFNALKEEMGKGNYIANINGKIKAFEKGVEIPVPQILYNEVETPYHFIANLKEFADRMARKHGVYKASKDAPIRVYHVLTDDDIKTVVNGAQEAQGLHVDETSVLVQNIKTGEFYVPKKDYLAKNYTKQESMGMYDVYIYTGEVQEWTFCEINIFAALWEGIQFLATPMLRIDNPKDVYGCNYSVFMGDDTKSGTHKILGFFRACGTQYFETASTLAIGAAKAPFNPPRALAPEEKVA